MTQQWGRLGSKGILGLLCAINLLVYGDRGVISSNGVLGSLADPKEHRVAHGIQGDFHLSTTKLGFLPSAFMVGLLVTCPFFAEASKHYGGFRLITVGLVAWVLSTLAAGLSTGYYMLLAARCVVGVGEASFVALAAPFIDDAAPKDAKGRWLAAFYLCVPTGYALGYIFGGLVAVPLSWRGPLIIEALLMLPLLGLCLLLPGKPTDIKLPPAGEAGSAARSAAKELWTDLLRLLEHPVYMVATLGITFHTAVLGLYGFFGAKSSAEVFRLPGTEADSIIGAITVLTGVLGSLAGGALLDRLGASVPNALALCAACCVLAFLLIGVAFMFAASLPIFVTPFALGELALFAVMSPSNGILLWSVPHALRPLAMSAQDQVSNWRITMSAGTGILLLGAAAFGGGILCCKDQPDYRLLVSAGQSSVDEEEQTPLHDQTA